VVFLIGDTVMRVTLAFLASLALLPAAVMAMPYDKIEHIIVIPLENHSFDNLFGQFPGAEGFDGADDKAIQRDRAGKAYATLPAVPLGNGKRDSRFPDTLANAPFPIEKYVSAGALTVDPVHRFFPQQRQINGGAMDQFAAHSNAGGLVMGYYDGSKLGLWDYAKNYTLADHFFHAAFGGSLLNHMWLVCACTPQFADAPAAMIQHFDAKKDAMTDGAVTEDGFVVDTAFSFNAPHPKNLDGSPKLVPPQTMPTIADRLEAKQVSWAWYSGGWNDAVAGKADALFQFHHQPFVYFKGFEIGSERSKAHLKDGVDFLDDLKKGTIPAVSFYKPLGEFNLHPNYASVTNGDAHVVSILKAIEASPVWNSTVVIVTFDENGGFWDHMPPPRFDRWGPGIRVPTLVISPLAKKHFVDHTIYDTTAILKFIETKFALEPLADRDKNAADMRNAFID